MAWRCEHVRAGVGGHGGLGERWPEPVTRWWLIVAQCRGLRAARHMDARETRHGRLANGEVVVRAPCDSQSFEIDHTSTVVTGHIDENDLTL